jgi:hypothetical protein
MSNDKEKSRASSKDSFLAQMEADIKGLDSQRINGKDLPKGGPPPELPMQRLNSDLVEVRLKQLQEKRDGPDLVGGKIKEPLASSTQ